MALGASNTYDPGLRSVASRKGERINREKSRDQRERADNCGDIAPAIDDSAVN